MDEILTTQDAETSDASINEVTEGKTFTQEQLDKIISSKLKQVDKKYEDRIKEIVLKEQEKAERLAKMSAEEKEKELMSQYKADIDKKERALRIREMHLEATTLLNERQIPIELAEFVIDADEEITKSRIDKLDKALKKAVESGVNEKLKGKPIEDYSSKNSRNLRKFDAVTVF